MTGATVEGQSERGLCGACRSGRAIVSTKGLTYILCEQSFTDAHYAKYPAIPVIQCDGYQEAAPSPDLRAYR